MAISKAMDCVRNEPTGGIPPHLKDAHYGGAKDLGRGLDYRYPHDYPGHYVEQQYLPDELKGRVFYEMSDNGYEKGMKAWLARLRNRGRQ